MAKKCEQCGSDTYRKGGIGPFVCKTNDSHRAGLPAKPKGAGDRRSGGSR